MSSSPSIDPGVRRFDEIARTWDESPRRTALARAVAGAILKTVPLTGKERALEFGCGTGLVTGFLAPSLGEVLAVDSSAGMLETLQRKLHELQFGRVATQLVDVSQDLPQGPFDLVYSSMTLHHIGDVAALFTRLHERLDPGGHVALADLGPEDGSFHGGKVPGVMHFGFKAADLLAWLGSAGFADAKVDVIYQLHKTDADGKEHTYDIQLATARRA